jgi:hypothetical protein
MPPNPINPLERAGFSCSLEFLRRALALAFCPPRLHQIEVFVVGGNPGRARACRDWERFGCCFASSSSINSRNSDRPRRSSFIKEIPIRRISREQWRTDPNARNVTDFELTVRSTNVPAEVRDGSISRERSNRE